MRIQHPVFADLPTQSERLAIRRQQQLYGCGVKSYSVVQRVYLVALVDSADNHHPHEDVNIGDLSGIPRENRLNHIWTVTFHNYIHPRRWDVDAWDLVNDLIHLNDDDCVVKGRGLYDHRRVLCVRAGVQVSLPIRLLRANQHHVRGEVDQQPRVELNIGMNRADLHLAVFEQLREPEALWTCEGKVNFLCNSQLEERKVFRPTNAGDD